jgi:hypothetical protein
MRTAFFLLLLLPLGVCAQTAESTFFIEVFGDAQIDVKPDILNYSVTFYDFSQVDDGFNDMGNAPVPVSIETAEKILLDLAKKHGVKPEKLLSDKYSVVSESSYGSSQLSYTFVFNDLVKLEGFVEDLRSQKIFNGSFSTMFYSKEKEAQRELRKAAFENARAKAEELAIAMGKKLGPATQIWEESTTAPYDALTGYYYGDGAEPLPTPGYGGDPSKSTLHSKLRVRFAFY